VATALVGGAVGYWLNERNTEQPEYRLVRKDDAFELRDYPALLTATVTLTGGRENALNRGFRRLAGYIFAKDRPGEQIAMTAPVMQDKDRKIAMTAPVLQDAADDPESWRVRFVMPGEYTRETLPEPPAGIEIAEIPRRRVAAIRFSGSANDRALRRREDELRRCLEAEGLQPVGGFEYAFYNSPFIPPFLRRNEVLVPVG
jgi:hypothetical protein